MNTKKPPLFESDGKEWSIGKLLTPIIPQGDGKMEKKLTASVLNLIDSLSVDYSEKENPDALEHLLGFESPIEQMLYISLEDLFKHFDLFFDDYQIFIYGQQKIKVHSRLSYRVDLMLCVCDLKRKTYHNFVIECDGHEFHEKTKEQAEKDRFRERKLMSMGYQVIRFTGSEIFNDSMNCSYDVWKIVKAYLDKLDSF